MVAPVIPGLNDHELPSILLAAAQAGARFAGHGIVRLPLGLGPLFEQWLQQHVPDKTEKVLSRVRDLHGGKLNDPRFGFRMKGEGPLAQVIKDLFTLGCRKAGIPQQQLHLSTAAFRRPTGQQLLLFE
jgi:DNA repair photolyase